MTIMPPKQFIWLMGLLPFLLTFTSSFADNHDPCVFENPANGELLLSGTNMFENYIFVCTRNRTKDVEALGVTCLQGANSRADFVSPIAPSKQCGEDDELSSFALACVAGHRPVVYRISRDHTPVASSFDVHAAFVMSSEFHAVARNRLEATLEWREIPSLYTKSGRGTSADLTFALQSSTAKARVEVTVEATNAPTSSPCTDNYVEVFDGATAEGSETLGRLYNGCQHAVSSGRHLTVRFHKASACEGGFRLRYRNAAAARLAHPGWLLLLLIACVCLGFVLRGFYLEWRQGRERRLRRQRQAVLAPALAHCTASSHRHQQNTAVLPVETSQPAAATTSSALQAKAATVCPSVSGSCPSRAHKGPTAIEVQVFPEKVGRLLKRLCRYFKTVSMLNVFK